MAETESADRAPETGQPYRCFLLRCRLEEGAGPGGRPAWRFTIQQVGPAEARRSFACLHDVEAYLEANLESSGQGRTGPAESTVQYRSRRKR